MREVAKEIGPIASPEGHESCIDKKSIDREKGQNMNAKHRRKGTKYGYKAQKDRDTS